MGEGMQWCRADPRRSRGVSGLANVGMHCIATGLASVPASLDAAAIRAPEVTRAIGVAIPGDKLQPLPPCFVTCFSLAAACCAHCCAQALGLNINLRVASGQKSACLRFMYQQSPVRCIFKSGAEHIRGIGQCAWHQRVCHVPVGADILSAGLPCHAFSTMRARTGKSACTGRDEDHPEFSLIIEDFPKLLVARRPGQRAAATSFSLTSFPLRDPAPATIVGCRHRHVSPWEGGRRHVRFVLAHA